MKTIFSTNYIMFICAPIICTTLIACGDKGVAIKAQPCAAGADSCVSYAVPGKVFPLKQPYAYACWAAAYTMLYTWKEQKAERPEDLLKPLGDYYYGLFKHSNEKGISQKDEEDFYHKAKLQIEYQLEPSIKGWASYLQDYGPLSVTIDARPPFGGSIHAILIVGIYGSIDGQHTAIEYVDPADGQLHEEPFMDFLPKYEALMAVDWPMQIIHLPKE